MTIRDLVYIALFAAIMAGLGMLPAVTLPLGVPITAQSMGPMLAGLIIGARRGFFSMALFILLVAMGLPLLAGGRGGWAVFSSPTGGFVIGFAFAALATGWLYDQLGKGAAWISMALAAAVGGIVVLYAFGLPYWMMITGQSFQAVLVAALPFIPGDILKVVIAASVALAVRRGYPGAFR